MDDEKSSLETVTDALKGIAGIVGEGVKSIASPASGTPIDMPHNESGAEIVRAARTRKRPAQKAAVRKAAKAKAKPTKMKGPKRPVAKKAPVKNTRTSKKRARR